MVYLFSSLGEFVQNVENPSRLDNAPTGGATTRAAFRKKGMILGQKRTVSQGEATGIHFQKGETDTPSNPNDSERLTHHVHFKIREHTFT